MPVKAVVDPAVAASSSTEHLARSLRWMLSSLAIEADGARILRGREFS